MAGQRPPRDKQRQQRAVQEAARERETRSQQRAVQTAARKRRSAPNLPPSEPVAAPSDNLGSIAPAPPVPWGWQSTELPQRPASHEAALMQPQPFFWPGVQDAPAAKEAGSPPIVPPSAGDTAGSSLPDPSGLEGAAAKAEAGTFTRDVSVALQGAEAKSAAGELTTVQPAAKAPPEPGNDALAASAEQRPAAYRFELRGGKIDILPEPPEPEDRGFALDTYQELVAKARELHERLKGTNSARRVCNSVERLLTALGTQFDDLRPGVLLSRSRSIEADRTAFGDELFPDTIAMMDDTLQTLRDLLAAFPIVRRIEAERLALDLDRSADAIPTIREQMDAIKTAAAQSGAVTEDAIVALTQTDAAIEDATDPVVRISLIADKILVFRNFVGAVIGGIASCGSIAIAQARAGLGELAGKSWEEVKNQLPKSIGATAALVPPFALVGLAVWLTDPVTGVAVTVATFKPMAKILKSFARDEKTKKQPKRGKNR
jgi:hypothetical protein